MDPVSVALGVGGLASNIFTNFQNQSNFRQQQANWREQMDFSKYQYEDSKRFNSAAAQVQRLRAAGINPSLAFGQNAGQAVGQSQPGQGGLPTQTPLDMNGLSAIGQGINMTQATKENLEADTAAKEADAAGQVIDNATRAEKNLSEIYSMNASSWYKDKMSELAKFDIDFAKQTMLYRIGQQRYDMELKDAEVAAATIALNYQVPETAARINELVSRQFANVATGRSSYTQARAALKNAFTSENVAKAMYGMDDKSRNQYFKATLSELENYAYKAKVDARYREWDVEHPVWSRFGKTAADLVGDGIGAGVEVYNAKKGRQARSAGRSRSRP